MSTPSFSSDSPSISCQCLLVGSQGPRQPSGCSLLGSETDGESWEAGGGEGIPSTPSLKMFPHPKTKEAISVLLISKEAQGQAGGSSSRGEGLGGF